MSNEINKLLSAWEDRRLNREGQAKLLGLMVDVMNGNRDEIDRLTQQLEAVEREREMLRSNAIYWHDEYDKLLDLANSLTGYGTLTLEEMLETNHE